MLMSHNVLEIVSLAEECLKHLMMCGSCSLEICCVVTK